MERVSITGLRGCCYLDKTLEGAPTRTEDREAVTLAGWTDRVYRDTPATIQLQVLRPRYLAISTLSTLSTLQGAAGGGTISLTTTPELADTVVWNPWAEKAGQMGDLGGDNWPGWVAHIYTISTHDIFIIYLQKISTPPGSCVWRRGSA